MPCNTVQKLQRMRTGAVPDAIRHIGYATAAQRNSCTGVHAQAVILPTVKSWRPTLLIWQVCKDKCAACYHAVRMVSYSLLRGAVCQRHGVPDGLQVGVVIPYQAAETHQAAGSSSLQYKQQVCPVRLQPVMRRWQLV
jgi:hypothetical protein